jgi:vacuolar-type H+-ATPase subunit E/Vma4
MPENEIKKALKEDFEREKNSILEEAKKSERDILISAEEESKKIKEECIREIKKKLSQEKQKIISQISLEIKKEILIEKEKLFNSILDLIKKRIEKLRKNKIEYYNLLKSLLIEAKEFFSDENQLKIKIDKEDFDLCKILLDELKLKIKIEIISIPLGGLILTDIDEKFIFDNTIESRLNKIIPYLRKEFWYGR